MFRTNWSYLPWFSLKLPSRGQWTFNGILFYIWMDRQALLIFLMYTGLKLLKHSKSYLKNQYANELQEILYTSLLVSMETEWNEYDNVSYNLHFYILLPLYFYPIYTSSTFSLTHCLLETQNCAKLRISCGWQKFAVILRNRAFAPQEQYFVFEIIFSKLKIEQWCHNLNIV